MLNADAASRRLDIDARRRRSIDADGFLVVRQVFSADRIAELDAEADRLRQRTDLIDTDNIRCRWQNHVDTGECRFDCFDPVIDLSAVCERTARDPRLLDIVGALYGEPACLFKDKLIFKPAGALGYQLHQDYISWKSFPTSFLTVIVAIDAADADNGATEVFPGYHQQGCLTPRDGMYHQLPDDAVDLSTGVVLDLAPGDVAIFSGYTPHRSGPNRSVTVAPAALSELQRPRATAASSATQHYAEFRGWLQDRYAEYGRTVDVLPMIDTSARHRRSPQRGSARGRRSRARSRGPAGSMSSSAAVIMLATLPGRTQGLGLITEPMLRDLQLDRVTYANINLWATLLGAVVCLPIGRRVRSRRPARHDLRADGAARRGGLDDEPARRRGARAAVPARAGDARARAERAVGRQHHRRRQVVRPPRRRGDGRLLGAAERVLRGGVHAPSAPRSASTAGAPPGRRSRWGLFCSRRRWCSCCASGPRTRPADAAEAGDVDDGLSLAAALRTPAFWVFGGATSLFGLVSSGLGLFNEAVLAERGFDQQTYVTFLAGTSIIALAGQFACGWLTLRWSMQRLLGLAMFIYAVALAALPLLTTLSQLWIFAALIGLSGGMITVLFFAVWRQAFGRGAPRPHSGRGADADGPRVGDRTAHLRAVRGADRVVHAGALDAGAVRAAAEHRGVSRHDARRRLPLPREVTAMAGAIDATLRKFHASLNVVGSRPLDRVLPRAARRRAGQGQAGLREVRSRRAAARPVADSRAARRRRQPQSRRAARANRRGAGRDSAPPRGGRHAAPSARKASSAATRGRRSSGSPIPIGALWEIYVFHDDIDDHGSAAPPRVEPLQRGHRAGAGAARPGSTISAIRFPREFHTTTTRCTRCGSKGPSTWRRRPTIAPGLLAEALRALRPGAAIYLHGLAGDRPSRSSPALPGPAAAVQHVPATGDVVDDLARAGFVEIQIEKLSETALLRRRRRADARAADRGAQAGSPAANGDAPGRVSRTDGAGHRRLRQRVPSRRADAAQRPRLADAVEERRERRVPVPEA